MDPEYTKGYMDGMRESAVTDLENTAMRIEILESELAVERNKKWELVNKIKLIDSGIDPNEVLDDGEPLTLHEKIDLIKSGWVSLGCKHERW